MLALAGLALALLLLRAEDETALRPTAAPAVSAAPPSGPDGSAPARDDSGSGVATGFAANDATPREAAPTNADRHRGEDDPQPGEPDRFAARSRPNLLAGGSFGEIHLETPEVAPGALSAPLEGLDTGAPRRLAVWQQTEDGEYLLLGEGESAEDGSLELPDLIATGDTREIVISPVGTGPDGFESSQPRTLEPFGVRPPQLSLGPASDGRSSLRVVAGESRGAVLLQTETGREIARLEIPTLPDPRRGIFDLELDLRPGTTILAAHQLPNGDLSATVVHRIEADAPLQSGSGFQAILEELSR